MLGRCGEAIVVWDQLCVGVRSGKYKYSNDAAGGIGYGLLLWFGAVVAGDEASQVRARAYLENRWRRLQKLTPNAGEIWPAPAARCVLVEITAQEMIAAATRNPSFLIDEPREMPPSDVGARCNLSTAFLVAGAEARRQGRSDEAHELFSRAAALENPVVEVSWYLARYEAEGHNSPLQRIMAR